jgi:hypothetical protein
MYNLFIYIHSSNFSFLGTIDFDYLENRCIAKKRIKTEKEMASNNAAPSAEAKSGVEVHWQSSVKTLSDGAAFMCMNELGADVFLKPMLNSGETAGIPKASAIGFSSFFDVYK